MPAGHGDRVVVENLVGDIDPGRDRRAYRQQARVEVGTVAQVLKYVLVIGERRLAEPGRTFATHLGKGDGAPIHPGRHVVATDAAVGTAALGQHRRGVVRASRAKPGFALGAVTRFGERGFLGFEKFQSLLNRFAIEKSRNARRDNASDHAWGQFAEVGHQQVAILVVFTDHAGSAIDRPVVELSGQLVLDDATFFLDHQDFLEPLGKLVRHDRLQRPAHADLVQADADLRRQPLVDAEIAKRLQGVEIRLAGGDDPEACIVAVEFDAVQVVGARKRAGGIYLVALQAFFLRHRRVGPASMHTVLRQLVIVRNHDLDTTGVDLGRDRGIHVFGNRLHPDPATAVTRKLPAEDAEVEHFLHAGGIEHRAGRADEHVIALVGQGRRLAGMVVADHGQHAAVG